MKIQKTLYRAKVQEYLDRIHLEDITEIELPYSVIAKEIGVIPLLFIVLLTIERRGTLAKITINVKNEDEYERFCDSYVGFIVLSTFWKSSQIVFNGYESSRSQIFKRNKKFHSDLINLRSLKMGFVIIPFFDHLPPEKGLPPLFYEGLSMKSEAKLENATLLILQSISRNLKKLIYPALQSILVPLMSISWELLGNTHNHARTDFLDKIILSPNLRGFQSKILSLGKKKLFAYCVEDQSLIDYYDSLLEENEIGNFLELTYFDSGPGISKRYLGNGYTGNISIEDEALAILSALKKGNSSFSGHQKSNHGFGLDRVMSILDEKSGFLKIRTGSLDVYRNLKQNPFSEGVSLYDVNTLSKTKFSKKSYLEGTVISIIIPLNISNG